MSDKTRTLVFVHGMYMNGHSWEPWAPRAREAGFEPLTPSWPFHEGEPATLREHIDPALGSLTFAQVVQHRRARDPPW